MEHVILDLQDQLRAIERANNRVGKLLAKFHADAAAALQQNGPVMGLSSDVVAPKEPPE